MKLTAKLFGESETRKLLKEFEKATGKGVERGIDEIAMSSARALASRVQPYGLTQQKGDKFMKNIAAQVTAAWFMVNLGLIPATSSMRAAHYAARRNGKVKIPSGGFERKGKGRWLGLISETERDSYIAEQQAKAGRAKAAWVSAGESLGIGQMSGVAQWIRRHVGAYGDNQKLGRMLRAKVQLNNLTPYISLLQKEREIQSALRIGRKNGLARMKRIIEVSTKKAAKEFARSQRISARSSALAQRRYERFQVASKKLHARKFSI